MKRFLITAAIVVLGAGIMSACGKDNKTTSSGATTTAAATASGDTITIVATNFQFDKTTLTATAGQPVTFKITNNGSVDHNLTIADLKVNTDVKPGKSADKTVTPAAGTYEYHCEYHPTQMKGTLTVS